MRRTNAWHMVTRHISRTRLLCQLLSRRKIAVKQNHRPKHVRRVGMVMLSKPTGAGGAERNWADVKVVFDKKKAATLPERVEK